MRGNPWLRSAVERTLLFIPLLIAGPLLCMQGVLSGHVQWLIDFQHGLYVAGAAILHGRPFYQGGFLARQVSIMHAGGIGQGELLTNEFSVPAYPALANLLVVPFALAPLWLAGLVYSVLSAAAMYGGLRLLGVSDRRCHGVALVSWPFLFGLTLGAIGPFLLLGTGAAWRWRERVWAPASAVASIVAIKIFPWTLAVWLLITRRYRALAVAVVVGAALTVGAWAAIGFEGMLQYPRMLSDLSLLQEDRGISVVTVAVLAGAPAGAATLIALAACAGILALAWRLASGPDGDRRAFGLATIAALATTPIVWEHYMVLLFVPIALASPDYSRLWLTPLAPPILIGASRLVVGDGPQIGPNSPALLRPALCWLIVQAVVGSYLCTSPARRSALWAALRARRPAPVGLDVGGG